MKTLLIPLLLVLATVIVGPGAACEVTDPTGTTPTCIDHESQSDAGPCPVAIGSSEDSITAYAGDGTTGATGGFHRACAKDAHLDETVAAGASVDPAGVAVGVSKEDHEDGDCDSTDAFETHAVNALVTGPAGDVAEASYDEVCYDYWGYYMGSEREVVASVYPAATTVSVLDSYSDDGCEYDTQTSRQVSAAAAGVVTALASTSDRCALWYDQRTESALVTVHPAATSVGASRYALEDYDYDCNADFYSVDTALAMTAGANADVASYCTDYYGDSTYDSQTAMAYATPIGATAVAAHYGYEDAGYYFADGSGTLASVAVGAADTFVHVQEFSNARDGDEYYAEHSREVSAGGPGQTSVSVAEFSSYEYNYYTQDEETTCTTTASAQAAGESMQVPVAACQPTVDLI